MANQFITKATVTGNFWARLRETVRREGIPHQWEALNDRLPDAAPSYCMRNFRIAAGKEEGRHGGWMFQDSDVAKWLEGVAYSLAWHPDPELEATADSAIDEVVAAQQEDGYLDTYYIIRGIDKRWTNLRDNHELYCAGHMLEAAVAYYEVTGKRKLLDAMIRFVDHIDSVLGPEEGKLHGYGGHPEIELALMRLYNVTHDEKHARLAAYFITQRGQAPLFFEEEAARTGIGGGWKDSPLGLQYFQAHMPLADQPDAVGHSVRALYLYSGLADVAHHTGDEALLAACRRLWLSATRRRMYINGGVGSSHHGEAFTYDYDLPNDTVYGETCASIALVFFAKRMLEGELSSEYADVMERALYNGIISGMQLDGKKFFYVNPLEVVPEACEKDALRTHVKPERQKWFGCACCPPNLIRLLTSLERYAYSQAEDALYTHLYMSGSAEADIAGTKVKWTVETDYPWHGEIGITVAPEKPARFRMALRIPGWCRSYAAAVNGEAISAPVENGYLMIDREWKNGDGIVLSLDMPVTLYRADPLVREDAGCLAVMRGPVVFCLEEADNGNNLHLVRLGKTEAKDFTWQYEEETLGGVVTLSAPGIRESAESTALYMVKEDIKTSPVTLRFIPYYAWANRGIGEMRVWVRE